MTTISNQNSLINPLARTKGGCASNNTHQTHDRDREEVDDGYNGMMPILGIQEDEDIASIEAEGTGDTDNGGAAKSQSRDVESKILTAALVTSMEDASRGGCKPKSKDDQAVDSNSMMYQHVTPTTSESSSVETTDSGDSHNDSSIPYLNPTGAQTSRKTPNPLSSNCNATRTTYPRASKAAACTKVASALHCNASPRSRRKMDAGEFSLVTVGFLLVPSDFLTFHAFENLLVPPQTSSNQHNPLESLCIPFLLYPMGSTQDQPLFPIHWQVWCTPLKLLFSIRNILKQNCQWQWRHRPTKNHRPILFHKLPHPCQPRNIKRIISCHPLPMS